MSFVRNIARSSANVAKFAMRRNVPVAFAVPQFRVAAPTAFRFFGSAAEVRFLTMSTFDYSIHSFVVICLHFIVRMSIHCLHFAYVSTVFL